jgi:hypothetical protein
MSNVQKALENLDLPEEFAQYDGQIKTRIQRQAWIYEVTDISSSPTRVYYTIGYDNDKTDLFGMYPLNYLAGAVHHMGFVYEGIDEHGVATLTKPAKFVKHEAPSGLAGQNVYYVWTQIKASEQGIDYMYEPYETVYQGVADDMKDPMIRVGYKARLVKKGPDGKPMVAWTSKYAITPKRRIRRAEFLQMIGITMEEFMYKTRWTWNRVATDPETHINNISMDIEQIGADQIKSVFYINGVDAQTFNYKTLINSFDKTYDGYMWMYRLHNGPGAITTDNVYGSTLNIGINPQADSTIKVVSGSVHTWDNNTKTLTYNPDLTYNAEIIAYAEFLPAGGKNENVGRTYGLETHEETLF